MENLHFADMSLRSDNKAAVIRRYYEVVKWFDAVFRQAHVSQELSQFKWIKKLDRVC